MKRSIIYILIMALYSLTLMGQTANLESLNPIKRYLESNQPSDFAEKFYGDTIRFSIPKAQDCYFESFKLVVPDTIWKKQPPKNKLPQEHKHFELVNNFGAISGWGVNSYRQYTSGTLLENTPFIIRGFHTEVIPYWGENKYILLEDVNSGKQIKWAFTNKENRNILFSSPSILRHLDLMKGQEFYIKSVDENFTKGVCKDVVFWVNVNPNKWDIQLYVDFETEKGKVTSHNWSPEFILKKHYLKINESSTEIN